MNYHLNFNCPKKKKINKAIIFIMMVLCSNINIKSQTITNTYWVGDIQLGGISYPINLRLEEISEGVMKAILQSPLQDSASMQSLPFDWRDDTVSFVIKNPNISYKGVLNSGNDSIIGNLKQGSFSGNLIFEKRESPFVVNRPQEPQPPYPYSEEEVQIPNKKANIVLSGTLTYPKEGKPFRAVILITGSGAQNRDEEILFHKPFKLIADYLSKNNIAVLRLDDRGVGKSTGNFATATTFDFASDIESAYEFLKKRPDIDSKRIGLIGHSEGSAVAAILASENKKVAFVISLAGMGVSGKETLLEQNKRLFELQGVDQRLINVRLLILKEVFDTFNKVSKEAFPACVPEIVRKHTASLSEEEKTSLGMGKKEVSILILQLNQPWWRTFLTLEPCQYFQKTKCPVLAINGEKDFQVDAKLNLEAIKKCGGKETTIVYMPGLNHLFQHCKTGSSKEYGVIEETFSPEALEIIKSWIWEQK